MTATATAYDEAVALAQARGLLGWSSVADPQSCALVVLSDAALGRRDLGRYLFVLVRYLHEAGYCVHMSANRELTACLATERFARMLLETDALRLVEGGDRDQAGRAALLLHDGCVHAPPRGTRKEIVLVTGRRLTTTPEAYDVLFPYMLHPKYYATGDVHRVDCLREHTRTIRLMFSGNFSPRYANPEIESRYGKRNRTQIIESLRSGLTDSEMLTVTEANADALIGSTPDPRFVFVDTSTGFRIAKDQWLATLGRCAFFLACPGVDMPLSHNLVEAMSVGAIPVTQCGDYFDPPLRHGQECFAHDGHDVVTAVRTVLAMDTGEISRMRDSVLAYYERYLTPQAFARRVLDSPEHRLRLGMNFMPTANSA